jgi:poly-beta-1,6-N-acetyl-D-glucosamine synthase
MFIFIIITVLLFLCYAILIIYYHRAWNSIPYYNIKEISQTSSVTKISVIIPVRNEEKNILNCIDSLSKQNYPKDMFEVIIIDDHSADSTWNILTTLINKEIKIVPIKLSDYTNAIAIKAYKKLAIETGINQSTGMLIITTDADCSFHRDWLQTISDFYIFTNAKFIAAPVKINATNSFLSIFQTLDFVTLQGITGASVFKKIHSMCNGANLAYEKKIFFEVDGFRDIDNIPSGDDMLLMHKIYKKYPENVFFLKNTEAIVTTQPETNWNGFINQRIRWASKADKYDDKRIFRVLLLVYIINVLFLALLVASFWNIFYLFVLLMMLLLKTFIEYPFVRSVAGFFKQQKLMIYFPLFQPLHILYTVVIGWLGKFGSYKWKERKVEK